MKKTGIVLFVSFIIILFANNELLSEQKSILGGYMDGQYVYYHDTRNNMNRITGLLKLSNNTLLCRSYDLKTQKETVVELELKQANGKIDIIPKKPYTKNISPNDIKYELQYVLVDFLNIAEQYRQTGTPRITKDLYKIDKWPEYGYTLEHRFVEWIPFFKLYSTRRTDSKEPFYNAFVISKLANLENDPFLKLKKVPTGAKQPSYKIAKSDNHQVELENLKFNLDDNWKNMGKLPDKGIPHVTYWIIKQSKRDAQIGVEKIKFDTDPMTIDKIACLVVQINPYFVVPSSVKYEKNSKYIKASFTTLDKTSFVENYYIQIIYQISRGEYNVLNFTTYKSLYDDNKEYFDSIINSIVQKK